MKALKILIAIIITTLQLQAQYTQIPDWSFEKELIKQGIDSEGNFDHQILTSDIDTLKYLDLEFTGEPTEARGGIKNLTGIEDFEALRYLNCKRQSLRNIDLSKNIRLETIRLDSNHLEVFDLSRNIKLKYLSCRWNAVKILNFWFYYEYSGKL